MNDVNISWGQSSISNVPQQPVKEREVKMAARGKYAWQVLERNKVVHTSNFQNNFIFDAGLDFVAARTWANCFEYCRVGIVATGSLQTSSGRNALAQYSLQSEYAGSNTYFTGTLPSPFSVAGCETSVVSGSGLLMRRTYDFQPEVGNQVYTEIGWSPLSNGNLFSRVIATSGGLTGVTVLEGQSIRVIYELEVFVGPSGQINGNPITGWNSSGTMGVQLFGLSSVGATGDSTYYDAASGSNEPSVGARGFITDNATALAALGSNVNRTSSNRYEDNTTVFPYVAGTYNRRKRFFIPASSGVFNGYSCVGIGVSGAGANAATNNSFVHVFSAPVNKELDYILLSSTEWEELRVAYRLKADTDKFRLRFSADQSVELRKGAH
jgi:hypothetical protein